LLDAEAAAWTRCDVARAMDVYWRSPELEIVDGTAVIRGWNQVAEERGRACRPLGSVRLTGLQLAGTSDMATVSGRWDITSAAGYLQTRAFTMVMRRFPDGEWKIVREVFPSPAAPVVAPSHLQRLLAGTEALVVPATLGKRLGLFDVGAGRGLLWFADIDTVIFDLALVFALWALFAASAAAAWRNPVTWLILLTTFLIAPPLAYSISNFGTLFRLREMIYLGLLLIPIAAAENLNKFFHPSS
jgi:ketosteroid isomerase-like protein